MSRIPLPTLHGPLVWGDVCLRSGWRIRENVVTGEYRLVDPANGRRASGTYEDCAQKLEEFVTSEDIPPNSGEVTLLLHGIIRASGSMGRIQEALENSQASSPLRFDYPSTHVSIERAAGYLRAAIDSLGPDVTRIHFVVHSMGGLVVREYGRVSPDPRLGRLVMLGTPNHGAEMASHFKKFPPFKAIFGPAGQQLIRNGGPIDSLPPPPCEFAVVYGARGTARGFNPFIPGDDDGTVSVESARLSGAVDSLAVRSLHSLLMYDADAVAACERFLRTGCLHEDGVRRPVE